MAKNGKFIIGALLGALFGLAFAPKKGSDLRKELKKEISAGGHGEKTLKENAAAISEDITEVAQEVYHDPKVQKQLAIGKKEASKLVKKAQDNLQSSGQEWVQVAREKLEESKDIIQKEAVKAFDTLKKTATQSTPVKKNTTTPSKSKSTSLKSTHNKKS